MASQDIFRMATFEDCQKAVIQNNFFGSMLRYLPNSAKIPFKKLNKVNISPKVYISLEMSVFATYCSVNTITKLCQRKFECMQTLSLT